MLKRGGSAIFNLMPVRVGDFDQPVTVRNRNALKHEAYSPTLADGTTGIPDCRFDRRSPVVSVGGNKKAAAPVGTAAPGPRLWSRFPRSGVARPQTPSSARLGRQRIHMFQETWV